MPAILDIFEQVEAKRKAWSPITPTKMDTVTPGAEDTISRCLALRCLEIPVKEFINDGLSKIEKGMLGTTGFTTLTRNIEDEEKHDIALNNCVKVFQDYDSSTEVEALSILEAWKNHPDFPITKAAVLENGIFFVILPLYRFFGYSALRFTAMDISSDEVNHVQSHRYAAKLSGHRPSKSLDDLRKETVYWIAKNLNVGKWDVDRCIKASNELMYKGITSELDDTQAYQVPAFFEHSNANLAVYS